MKKKLLILALVIFASLIIIINTFRNPDVATGTLDICITDGLQECLPDLLRNYSWQVIAAVLTLFAGLFIALAYLKGAGNTITEISEKQTSSFLKEDVSRDYLKRVVEDYNHFNFRGLETIAKGVKVPEFEHGYISLSLMVESDQETSISKEQSSHDLPPSIPTNISSVIQQHHKLVLLGGAGCGKSTLLQWVGISVANSVLKPKSLTKEQLDFVNNFARGKLIPILITLREFNHYCEENNRSRTPTALVDFMIWDFKEKHPGLDLPEIFFKRHLEQGCIIMFDALDEVDLNDRARVRESIEGLVNEYGTTHNRYLLTSRTVAYEGTSETVGFTRCEIQNLDNKQRDDLIKYWCSAAYPRDEAEREANKLCRQIEESDNRIRDLARTPLMVSIFAVVHYGNRSLPRQRAELYENAIHILLTEPHHSGEAIDSLAWNKISAETRRDRLARIAYELHTINQDALLEDELVEKVWNEFGNEEKSARQDARQFIRLAADRGGLIEEYAGKYGFLTHRTFREFLVGRYIAEQLEDNWNSELAQCIKNDHWLEVVRLAAGFLALTNARRANKFVQLLASIGTNELEHAHSLIWAALSLSDFPYDRIKVELHDKLANELLAFFSSPPAVMEPNIRRQAGLALSAIGDPRFISTSLIKRLTEYSLLRWTIPVPTGTFDMGTSDKEIALLEKQKIDTWDVADEKPQHKVFISSFLIGKYPITNSEFRLFVEDRGYDNQSFWTEEGWKWRTGLLDNSLDILLDIDLRKSYSLWLSRRPKNNRTSPYAWDDPDWNADNLPVVGVTWYEASAYCSWLSYKLRSNKILSSKQIVRLPTEAEWEKASKLAINNGNKNDEDSILWPWGNFWDPNLCNSSESRLGGTTPVGMYSVQFSKELYPQDIIGNVWEWCMDWYEEDIYNIYSSAPQDKNPSGPQDGFYKVARGGSWRHNREFCRNTRRRFHTPTLFSYDLGFRVAISPF